MYPCPCQICHLLGHAGNIHETLSESPPAEASGVICKTMDFNHLVFTMICNWKIIWLKIWGRKDLKWPLNGSLANGREAPVKITFITLLIRVCVCVCVCVYMYMEYMNPIKCQNYPFSTAPCCSKNKSGFENKLTVAKREKWRGERKIMRLKWTYTHYYLQNRSSTKTHCVLQGTLLSAV